MGSEECKIVIKAAKKVLKKGNGSETKLSELVVLISKKTKVHATDVEVFIRGSKPFIVNDDAVVLRKKRGIDSQTDEEKNRKERKKAKKQKHEGSDDDLTNGLSPSDVPAWRLKHKIIVLPTVEGDNAESLQQDPQMFPFPTFSSCRISLGDALVSQCTNANNFKKPSPIQAQAWPILVNGKDLVGIAETGSGKTLAFSLPALSMMSSEKKPRDPRMLVLAPTRELAMQSEAVLSEFGAVLGLRSITIYGGVPKHAQAVELKKGGIDCIVGTPGRLKDFINDGTCRLSTIRFLVLDEADSF